MPQALVECIPNFSEGRRPEVVAEIEAAITAVPDVHILDRHIDADHNRSVITFVAPPEAAQEAAFKAIAKAAERIDLDQHEGEHPRIGAADVVPFVPLQGVTMEECVELARSLGARVGAELSLPVYLYEKAATTPERTNLEDIRRGEYEGLKERIQSDPSSKPDFGPAEMGSAGATVIGARAPLIAYNLYLSTEDVEVAKKVASAIRHSSGGLRFVKALGLLVEGRAQVSMNLTDFRRTPIARVTELVRREAGRYGVTIHHAELVGLAPQEAFIEAARWYLQLDQFEPDQILETRLYQAMMAAVPEEGFLDRLAAGTPTPGGGSASAHVGATAAALVAMVARLTAGKEKYAEVDERMRAIAAEADELRSRLLAAVPRDAAAFESYLAALRLPRSNNQEQRIRAQAMEAAIQAAAAVPLEVAEHACRLVELAAEVAEVGNVNAISDAATGGEMAAAALRSAGLNVRVNAQSASDDAAAETWVRSLEALEAKAAPASEKLRDALLERANLPLP